VRRNRQMIAWTGSWIFWIRTPAAYNRIKSEVFFAISGVGLDLDFVFGENTLLVVCLTYIYAESNSSWIASVMFNVGTCVKRNL